MLLATIAFATLPVATTASAARPVLAECGNSYYGGKVKPRTWSSGCVGASFNTHQLRWSSWGRTLASGRGLHRYNDCEPSCAAGSSRNYRVTLRLSRVRSCYTENGRARMFTRVRFVTAAPGVRRGTFSVLCAREPF